MAAPPPDEKIWSRLLAEVHEKSSSTLPDGGVLVLGDDESGKSTLVQVLQGSTDSDTGGALKYTHLDVKHDYSSGSYAYMLGSTMGMPEVGPAESTRLSVWTLGEPKFAPLLKFALTPQHLDSRMILLCASMSTPWSIMESLERWSGIIDEYMNNITSTQANVVKELRQKQERFWQEYVEPLDSSSHSENGAKIPSMETDDMMLPLGDAILTNNTGLPFVVVITKCDQMSTVERECDFDDEHFDFIQQAVRKFCVRYGAALFYTSIKPEHKKSVDVLYKYMLHRVYGFPFCMPASVVDKDAVFIPAGWDSLKKIGIVEETLRKMKGEDSFSTHIRQPPTAKRTTTAIKEPEIAVENEDDFVAKIQKLVNAPSQSTNNERPPVLNAQTSTASIGGESPLPSRNRNRQASPAVNTQETPTRQDTVKDGGSETLQAFFNNLLKAKPDASPGSKSKSSPKPAVPNGVTGKGDAPSNGTPPSAVAAESPVVQSAAESPVVQSAAE